MRNEKLAAIVTILLATTGIGTNTRSFSESQLYAQDRKSGNSVVRESQPEPHPVAMEMIRKRLEPTSLAAIGKETLRQPAIEIRVWSGVTEYEFAGVLNK